MDQTRSFLKLSALILACVVLCEAIPQESSLLTDIENSKAFKDLKGPSGSTEIAELKEFREKRSKSLGDSSRTGYQAEEVIGKTPIELIKLRGFEAEKHTARTSDGYFIHVVRIINPLLKTKKLKRPIIFNHGLLESATIWLINARGVKPLPYEFDCELSEDQSASTNMTRFLNGPMMLANNGYDVWLMSMRGTDWSLRHEKMSPKDAEFWNYCLDDFALVDIPTVVNYVRTKTGAPKVGYIGHSQATFSVFALLATHPEYDEVLEPVIAVAPVSFFHHITSIARILFIATLRGTDRDKHGPFPPNARKVRKLLSKFCSKDSKGFLSAACDFIEILIGGIGRKWREGFYAHVPFYTSLKVLRHFGQLISNRRFMMYDYGEKENLKLYGTPSSPSYPIEKISSKALCLISTETDALSPPGDVEKFKERLTVPLFRDIKIKGDFNHFDLITDEAAKHLVFAPILEICETFELQNGACAKKEDTEWPMSNELENHLSSEFEVNHEDF